MLGRLVIVDIGLGHPSPTRSGAGPHQRCQAQSEQVLGLAEVDNVEYDPLVLMNILNSEVEPKSMRDEGWLEVSKNKIVATDLYLGLQVSGRTNKSYSNSLIQSTRPRLPTTIQYSAHITGQ